MITECESCKFKIATIESLETERNNLREALEKYGQHLSASQVFCELLQNPVGKCTCGLWEAQALTQPNQNRGEVVG